ncbi:MAG: YchJ family metal-binding protein [Gammaproteobacteria bacterium]|nr:YchJ family metal-binding protein [Gammaproteobacteria bacterium]
MDNLCPCGSTKLLDCCCGLLHSGEKYAKTPKQLMRSRYSAYALGGLGEYLLSTWHPKMIEGLSVAALSEKSNTWLRLDIIDYSQQGDEGIVEFKAYYVSKENSENYLHERSYFQRLNGRWFYVSAVNKKSPPA